MIQRKTVGIIGTGNVGAAAAYALFNQRVVGDLILLDADAERAHGEAMDLMHGQMLVGNIAVRSGSYEDLAEAQVVVVTAGARQASPDESRLELLNRNAAIFREIIAELDRHAPEAVLVVATNPVDILTYASQELSRRPHRRVVGTGTLLDTARFRALLGQHYGVDPRSVHAYILGEHGDSEVPIWSNAAIGGERIVGRAVLGRPFDRAEMDGLFESARTAAYAIIERKGYTNAAIGVVITRIVKAILDDERTILPLSVRLTGEYGVEDVCLSIPCLVGREGVEARIPPEITDEELQGLRASAETLRKGMAGVRWKEPDPARGT